MSEQVLRARSLGKILPNANDGTELICDAFVWVKRQNPGTPGMTVLAGTGIAKSAFGRPRGESIERSWRFTQRDAVAAAVFAAQRISPVYDRFSPDDDRVSRAIAVASNGDKDKLEAANNAVALAASYAHEAGDEAATFAAGSARAAVLAAWAADAGAALHATAYSILYSIQCADKIGMGEEMTQTIEKWLYVWISGRA